jgi:hypothetical protein
MDNLEFFQVFQSVEQLNRESAHQIMIEACKVVDFQKFKQIHAQQLKTNTQMSSKDYVVIQMDNIHDVFRVILF